MGYNTPPTLDPGLKADCQQMIAVLKRNSAKIKQNFISHLIRELGVTPRISTTPLTQFIDRIVTPTVHTWEGHYGEHPNDSGGATCRGVILTTFCAGFDYIYSVMGTPETKQAIAAFEQKHRWKNGTKVAGNPQISKQVLYLVNTDEDLASLWVYKFFCSSDAKYPLGMMMFDPWLGYVCVEGVWGTGSGVYGDGYSGWNKVMKSYFPDYDNSGKKWILCVQELAKQNKTAEFTSKLFQNRIAHIDRISKPGHKNNVFRKGWFRRLLNSKNSDLMMMVRITELLLKNKKGDYKLDNAEKEYCANLAKQYEGFSIDIPTT